MPVESTRYEKLVSGERHFSDEEEYPPRLGAGDLSKKGLGNFWQKNSHNIENFVGFFRSWEFSNSF